MVKDSFISLGSRPDLALFSAAESMEEAMPTIEPCK